MAVSTKEDLVARLTTSFGENLSDDNISLLEDVSDTLDSFLDSEDWKTKYEENDASWRKRYKERFEGKEDDSPENEPEIEHNESPTKFEDLFTVESEVK
jgi:hypothetical protein